VEVARPARRAFLIIVGPVTQLLDRSSRNTHRNGARKQPFRIGGFMNRVFIFESFKAAGDNALPINGVILQAERPSP
jgi:hypothetical protein